MKSYRTFCYYGVFSYFNQVILLKMESPQQSTSHQDVNGKTMQNDTREYSKGNPQSNHVKRRCDYGMFSILKSNTFDKISLNGRTLMDVLDKRC